MEWTSETVERSLARMQAWITDIENTNAQYVKNQKAAEQIRIAFAATYIFPGQEITTEPDETLTGASIDRTTDEEGTTDGKKE